MGHIQHKTLAYTEQHVIHFKEYADADARTGAEELTEDDDYKVALQTDDHSLWILTDYSGPTWVPIGIPSGTIMLFGQNSAPTGWTRKADWQDNAMLCYASAGAIGSGGTVNPQSVHTHGNTFSVDNYTLLIADMPAHTHPETILHGNEAADGAAEMANSDTGTTGSTGGSGGHAHGLSGSVSNNTAPHYQEVIAATKD